MSSFGGIVGGASWVKTGLVVVSSGTKVLKARSASSSSEDEL